jgi:hypothetical protein
VCLSHTARYCRTTARKVGGDLQSVRCPTPASNASFHYQRSQQSGNTLLFLDQCSLGIGTVAVGRNAVDLSAGADGSGEVL